MIDQNNIEDDPIVAEVRRAREEYAARFNFDLRAISEDLRRLSKEEGINTVSRQPRRPLQPKKPAKEVG